MEVTAIPGFTDPFSAISHITGAILFLFFGVRLVRYAKLQSGVVAALTTGVFVSSVVFLLSMSGVFHLLEHGGGARTVLQRLDHAAIFALIAGTFTPIHGILFRGFWRWGVLFVIWTLAIAGITLKSIFFNDMAEWVGLMFYLGLGWIGVLTAFLAHRLHGFQIIKPLLYGALAYTVGASLEFLRMPVLVPGVLGPHELFHLAVLAGIMFHWSFIRSLLQQRLHV
jgi:channel protein (hemolysin III family)